MRILIVDDEAPVVELLASFCEGVGHDVSTCTSSLEALAHLTSTPVDVLITDIVMMHLDGLSLVREARQHDPHLEAIVITGYASNYSLEEVLRCGASDLITKPVRMKEFRARVGLAIERRRLFSALKTRHNELQATSTEMIQGLQQELEEAVKERAAGREKPAS
jgi:DNA-binding response OmpR family regulator